jgi:histone arginine demethylase JMJD6
MSLKKEFSTTSNVNSSIDIDTRNIAQAKKRVRPDWSVDQWSQRDFRSQTWPAPREGIQLFPCRALPPQAATGSSMKMDWDWNHPQRFSQALQKDWPDVDAFSMERLLQDYGDLEVCVGSDDTKIDEEDGEGGEDEVEEDDIMLPLEDYVAYAARDADGDDAPIYVFDDWILSGVDEAADFPLAQAYHVPHIFQQHDYMSVWPGGMEERPPFCWLLVGAPRSGTALHVDPICTAAWNTLVSGRKRWMLFPPFDQNDKNGNKYEVNESEKSYHIHANDEAATNDSEHTTVPDSVSHWFQDVYPTLPRSALQGVYDFVQNPGETVYVPNGWKHCVLNLDLSVAVTHNFVGPHNVELALDSVRSYDTDLAREWEENLKQKGWA